MWLAEKVQEIDKKGLFQLFHFLALDPKTKQAYLELEDQATNENAKKLYTYHGLMRVAGDSDKLEK